MKSISIVQEGSCLGVSSPGRFALRRRRDDKLVHRHTADTPGDPGTVSRWVHSP